METAVRTTTGSRRRKTHSHDRPRQPSMVDGEYLESLGSSQQMPSDYPTPDELRRVRTEFYRKSPEERRREAERNMDFHTTQGRHPRSRRPSVKVPDSSIRDLRRDHESKHRHRREKYKEEPEQDTVYVYKQVYDSPKDADHARPMPRRRPSAPRASTRYHADGVRAPEPSIARRHTERRASGRKEAAIESSKFRRRSDSDVAIPSSVMSRSASVRDKPSRLPPLARSHSTAQRAQPFLQSDLAIPIITDKVERKISGARRVERPPSILGSIFGMQKPQEAKPERLVECLTCASADVPISKSAKLACKHRMCHSCLRMIFKMSIKDPQHMPPKCCTQEHIPLRHVEKLFDTNFKIKWNQKYQEYTTKNRIYCPAKGCGEWIKPSQIHLDTSGGANTGRKYGKCGRCKTKVCCICNGKWHTSRECPKDEATKQFAEIAKKEGWRRCYNCSAMVELKEGCNHMTCRCQAQFCMSCGEKWKTCDCPWFTYQAVEADRLLHMNPPRRAMNPGGPGHPNPALHQHEGIDRRREQERLDENLARRMQALGLDRGANGNNNFVFPPMPPPSPYLNRDHAQRNAAMISGAAMHAMAAARHVPHRPPPDVPRPSRLPQNPQLRHHSAASRRYNNDAQTRPSERVVPRRSVANYDLEALSHRPARGAHGVERESVRDGANDNNADTDVASAAPGARGGGGEAPTVARPGRRHSVMAGLTGGSGQGRVDEWRRYIGEE